jgi:hypothetical protein
MINQAAGHRFQPNAPMSRVAAAEKKAEDERSTVWAFVWTLFAFKVVTLVATVWAASGSFESAIIVLATNWFWLAIPAFAIAGPFLFHLRLRRARRRRAQMLRSEWMID